ncbi:hypothetical protein niasHS_000962 [Heterodera schachtii]|uniref:Uncharacterized protein n=1 Tax=Heterodera schachtii TaxID=97005 RepID=A0ABD2K881_HETSC
MLPRRRGFQSVHVPEKTRTHLLFSAASDPSRPRRKKRPQNKFHQIPQHKRDEIVLQQGGVAGIEQLDPTQWTGNQRIVHFGPMAQRDPFFYFYPKGWDLLYPAQFGFFPYRTNKFLGSSAVVCVWAFGIFLFLGGILMIYLGYFIEYKKPFWRWTVEERQNTMVPPVQIAGPLLAGTGILLLVVGMVCSVSNSQFLSDKLRHHHHRDQPASVTVYTTHYKQPRATYEVSPYQPLPPPANPVYVNPNARTHLLDPNKELKLFPPVVPGQSTLSLHGKSATFVASPYNTLRAISMQRSPSHNVVELRSASADPPFPPQSPPIKRTKRRRANSSQSVAKSSSADEPWEIKTVVKSTTTTIRRQSSAGGSSGGADAAPPPRGGAGTRGSRREGGGGMVVMAYR